MNYIKCYNSFKNTTEIIAKRYVHRRFLKELLFAIEVFIVVKSGKDNLLDTSHFIVKKVMKDDYVIKHYYKFLTDKITNPATGNTYYQDKTDIALSSIDIKHLVSLKQFVASLIQVTEQNISVLQEEIDAWENTFTESYDKVLEPIRKQEIIDAITEGGVDALMAKPAVIKEDVTK